MFILQKAKYFIFCSYSLFAFILFIQNYNSQAIENDLSFMARIDVPSYKLDDFVLGILNGEANNFIKDKITHIEFEPQTLGGDPEKCKSLKKIPLSQAWIDCPGIPEYFLKDTERGVSRLKPRPMFFTFTDFKIKELEALHFDARTDLKKERLQKSDESKFKITLKTLTLTMNFKLEEMKSKKLYWNTTPMTIRITSPEDNSLSLSFNTNLVPEAKKGRNYPVLLQKANISLREDAKVEIYLNNSEAPINIREYDYRPFLSDVEEFLSNRTFAEFLNEVNEDVLTDQFIRVKIQEILNDKFKSSLVNKINQLIYEKILGKEFNIDLPELSIHQLVNAQRYEMAHNYLLNFSLNFHEKMKPDEQGKKPKIFNYIEELKKNKAHLAFIKKLSEFGDDLSSSNSKENREYFNFLEDETIKLSHAAIYLKEKIYHRNPFPKKSDEEFAQEFVDKSMEIYAKSLDLREDFLKRREEAKKQSGLCLYMLPSLDDAFPDNWHLTTLSNLGDPLFKDSELSVVNAKNYDFMLQVSLKSLNQILEKMTKRGDFDFTYYDYNIYDKKKNVKAKIKMETAPILSWNQEKAKYEISIDDVFANLKLLNKLSLKESIKAKMYFLPEVERKVGERYYPTVKLSPEFKISRNYLAENHGEEFLIKSLLKASSIIHPIVLAIVTEKVVKKELEKYTGSDLQIPEIPLTKEDSLKFDIVKTINAPEWIKIYFKKRPLKKS